MLTYTLPEETQQPHNCYIREATDYLTGSLEQRGELSYLYSHTFPSHLSNSSYKLYAKDVPWTVKEQMKNMTCAGKDFYSIVFIGGKESRDKQVTDLGKCSGEKKKHPHAHDRSHNLYLDTWVDTFNTHDWFEKPRNFDTTCSVPQVLPCTEEWRRDSLTQRSVAIQE